MARYGHRIKNVKPLGVLCEWSLLQAIGNFFNFNIKRTQSASGLHWPGHKLSHFEKSSPQPEIKVHLEFHFNLCSVLLDFESLTSCLCVMQISHELVSNAQARQLTVSL